MSIISNTLGFLSKYWLKMHSRNKLNEEGEGTRGGQRVVSNYVYLRQCLIYK